MLIALIMALFVLGQTPTVIPNDTTLVAPSEDRTADEAAIREGASAWAGAFTRGDIDLVDRILADDFVGMTKDGTLYDKQTMLGWVRGGPNLTSSDTTVEQVRFFGDIAIATGSDNMVGAAPELRRIRSIWTDIWIRRKGQWRVIAAHDMAGATE